MRVFFYLFTSLPCVGFDGGLKLESTGVYLALGSFLGVVSCYFKQLLFDQETERILIKGDHFFTLGLLCTEVLLIYSNAAGRGSYGRTRKGALNPSSRQNEDAHPGHTQPCPCDEMSISPHVTS